MGKQEIIELYNKYVVPSYTRFPLCLARGKGSRVWDSEGKEYLDFFPGWAVSGLGHSHPRVVKALKYQAKRLLHVSNNYYSELQGLLAKKIVENSFDGKVFFCNSGAEANEAAVKLARKWGSPARYEVITMKGSFHGRTLAMIAATGQDKVKKGFDPLPAGFKSIEFNNLDAVKAALTPQTAAIMLELIQGEGGINVADREYVRALRQLCDENGILLIFDEVQTGMGRTGNMFCFENYEVEPDIMTLAKSLGSGVPIGAMVASEKVADVLSPGTHASTFGGGPLVCRAALAVFEAIEKEKLLSNATRMGEYLRLKLNHLKKIHPQIKEVKGIGLMIGVALNIDAAKVYEAALEKGLLINATQGTVLRIMPPLTVMRQEIDKAVAILDEVFKRM